MSTISIALLQLNSELTIDQNIDKQLKSIREAAESGAQIIFLQELALTQYFCREYNEEHFDLAMDVEDSRFQAFSELAKELGIVIFLPFFERRAAGLYHNSLLAWDADGRNLGIYRKMHIPDDPSFYEKYYFTPGDLGYKVFKTRFGNVGTLICWDQWYPEAARITALMGADILYFPTAIGILASETDEDKNLFHNAWHTTQKSHGIDNGCFVVSVNRSGSEDGQLFWGKSFVSGPFGQILAQADEKEEIILTKIDLSEIESTRKIWPFLRDRRIDSYQPITRRFID